MMSLLSSWWYDDFDELTRFMKNAKSVLVVPYPRVLPDELEESLRLILSWQFGQWDQNSGGNASWKSNWTKREFEALLDTYPAVRL